MKQIATSEVLDLAADAIQMAGWTQGPNGWPGHGFPSGDHSICLEGGIMAALGYEEDNRGMLYRGCPAYAAVQEYLGLERDRFLFYWNDHVAESQEQVIEVLRAAAAVERVKEATVSRGYETEDQPLPVEIPAA